MSAAEGPVPQDPSLPQNVFLRGLQHDTSGHLEHARDLYNRAISAAGGQFGPATAFLSATFDNVLANGNIRTKLCKHGYFTYFLNDFIGQSLHLYGEWCDDELHVMKQLVPQGSVVVDIGANIGVFTVPLARHIGPHGRLYAFEPQRIIFQLMCSNVAANGIHNVMAVQGAASNQAGKRLFLAPLSYTGHFESNFGAVSLTTSPGSHESEPISASTIDSLDLPSAGLIKVDVEGMELDVLQGARDTMHSKRPMLYVENNSEDGNQSLIELVKEHNYDLYWHITPYYNPANHFKCAYNHYARFMPSINMVCIPREKGARLSSGFEPAAKGDNWRTALERMARRSTVS